ncbi:MAG: hypothetical protein K2X86_15735 [Cytophagaceae bacterium]|nr:hypothetical protein [Cytophagaceae bacterium]
MKKKLLIGGIAIALILVAIVVFNMGKQSAYTETYQAEVAKSPEEIRMELLQKESSDPLSYLTVKGTARINLIGESVFEGSISNSATLASYKDVKLKLSCYSKTKTLLGEKFFTIYEFVRPNASVPFKQKVFLPDDVKEYNLEVVEAISQ